MSVCRPDEFGGLVSIRPLLPPLYWTARGWFFAAGGELNQGEPVPARGSAGAADRRRVCGVLAENEELVDRRGASGQLRW